MTYAALAQTAANAIGIDEIDRYVQTCLRKLSAAIALRNVASIGRRPGMPNVELHIEQQSLGPASLDTTARYVNADRDARLNAMKKWRETTSVGRERV